MSVTVPKNPKDDAYLYNKSGSATFNGPWFDASECKSVVFQLSWSAFAATDGTLSCEGTNDPAQAAGNQVTLAVGVVNVGASIEPQGTWPTVGATASKCTLKIVDPPHFVRISYTRIAGGTTNQFQGFAFGRSI